MALEYVRRGVRASDGGLVPDADDVSAMTTAIIGTGGIGSAIACRLASGGETLRLSNADRESARKLAAEIGDAALVAVDNRDALQGAGAAVLALRFTVLESVIDEVADSLTDRVVVVPSNPVGLDARGNVVRLPIGRAILRRGRGRVAAHERALGDGVRNDVGRTIQVLQQPLTGASGPLLRDQRRPCRRGSRKANPDGRLRAGEGRRNRTVESTRGGRRPSRSRRRLCRGAIAGRRGLIASSPRPEGTLTELNRVATGTDLVEVANAYDSLAAAAAELASAVEREDRASGLLRERVLAARPSAPATAA
jgi:hypothetical protein